MLIHQTLHGYNQGHTLLASSFSLPSVDDDMLKVMSDWTEYSGDVNGDSSYIMGYPLADGKYYAIAKSWYADEMPRPGCVWTHTFLVDLEQLDNDFDFRQLFSLFKRPENDDYRSYNRDLEVIANQLQTDVDDLTDNNISKIQLMYLLVQFLQSKKIFAVERSSEFYQILCLTLIQYLPSGILSRVAFSSGSASGRNFQNVESSLQFANHNSALLFAMNDLGGLEVSNFNVGIRALGNAIYNNDKGLPKFLRLFSDDIGSSVTKLCAVAYLSECLDQAMTEDSSAVSYKDILSVIADSFPSGEGLKLKQSFLKERVSNVFESEEKILGDLATFQALQSLNYDFVEFEERVISLCHQDKDAYIRLLSQLLQNDYINAYGNGILNNSYKHLQQSDLEKISSRDWQAYISLVTVCPQLLTVSFWVDFPKEKFLPTYEIFQKHTDITFDRWDVLFKVVLYKNYHIDDIMRNRFITLVHNIVYQIMDYLNDSVLYILNDGLCDYCLTHFDKIESWMNAHDTLGRGVVLFLMENVNPNAEVVKRTSSSAWKAYANSSYNYGDKYYTFLFLLSYNWNDDKALSYMQMAFYPLHQLAAENALSWDCWNKLQPYIGSVMPWQEWDKCKKLRKGVVSRLKALKVTKAYVASFTPDPQLNKILIKKF